MRLIIDAMGGDLAPQAPVAGALQAIQTYGCQVILVGQEEVIRQTLAKEGVTNLPDGLTIHNATQVIEICDNPSTAWRRKKDSSLTVGMNLLMAGEGDAFLSAGSTVRRWRLSSPRQRGRPFSSTPVPTQNAHRNTSSSSPAWAAFTPTNCWGWKTPRWVC